MTCGTDVADAVGFCHLRSGGVSAGPHEELSRRARDSAIRTAGACGSVKQLTWLFGHNVLAVTFPRGFERAPREAEET